MPDLSQVAAYVPQIADALIYIAIVIVTLTGLIKCCGAIRGRCIVRCADCKMRRAANEKHPSGRKAVLWGAA